MNLIHRVIRHLFFGFALSGLALVAAAQSYPVKPIRLIIAFAPGGGQDINGRRLAKELTEILGQTVFVENKPGVSGLIGLEALTNSTPDGYTIMLLPNTTTVALHFQNKSLDAGKRFEPIASVSVAPMLLLVNPAKIDVKTLPELVTYLKSNPGTDYTSSGPGSPGFMGMEAMAMQSGIKVTHIPYKGIGPAVLDTLAGRVGLIVADGVATRPHVVAGKLRPIAAVSTIRSPLFPDLPRSGEQGYPTFVNDSFSGIVAPPGTPATVIEVLKNAIGKAVATRAYSQGQLDGGNQSMFVSGVEFRDLLQQDFDRWGKVIREAGMKQP